MSKEKPSRAFALKAVEPVKPPRVDELPIHQSLWHGKVPGGWAVILFSTQGTAVVEKEVLTHGAVPRQQADDCLKVEVLRRFLVVR